MSLYIIKKILTYLYIDKKIVKEKKKHVYNLYVLCTYVNAYFIFFLMNDTKDMQSHS